MTYGCELYYCRCNNFHCLLSKLIQVEIFGDMKGTLTPEEIIFQECISDYGYVPCNVLRRSGFLVLAMMVDLIEYIQSKDWRVCDLGNYTNPLHSKWVVGRCADYHYDINVIMHEGAGLYHRGLYRSIHGKLHITAVDIAVRPICKSYYSSMLIGDLELDNVCSI